MGDVFREIARRVMRPWRRVTRRWSRPLDPRGCRPGSRSRAPAQRGSRPEVVLR